jgi:segregation and condensation protein B
MNSVQQLEAILFYFAEPKSIDELTKMLKISKDDVWSAVNMLRESLSTRGVRLMVAGEMVSLATAPEASEMITRMVKEEREKELGKAGLETLSIILYHGPLTRSAVDHIRGVNSTFIIRNLLIRGLVEKVENPQDQRSFLYRPTLDLLRHLGVARVEDLPSYQETKAELESFLSTPTISSEEEKVEPVISADDDAPSSADAPERIEGSV